MRSWRKLTSGSTKMTWIVISNIEKKKKKYIYSAIYFIFILSKSSGICVQGKRVIVVYFWPSLASVPDDSPFYVDSSTRQAAATTSEASTATVWTWVQYNLGVYDTNGLRLTMKKIKSPTSWRPHRGQWGSVVVSVTDMDASDNKVKRLFFESLRSFSWYWLWAS